jgi:hypothetical protein
MIIVAKAIKNALLPTIMPIAEGLADAESGGRVDCRSGPNGGAGNQLTRPVRHHRGRSGKCAPQRS